MTAHEHASVAAASRPKTSHAAGRLAQQPALTAQLESGIPPIVREVLASPGQPLDPETRAFMEPRFGHDFSRVQVHTDAKAAQSARAVNALAYAIGQNVVFAPGQYRPTTPAGQQLLAHELTHTVQQDFSPVAQPQLALGDSEDTAEHEAGRVARSVAAGGLAGIIHNEPAGMLRRQAPPAPRAETRSTAELTSEERLLLYQWLSRWQIDTQPGSLLRGPRLGENPRENIERLARAIWERRLAAEARPDPHLLMGPLPDDVRALADGPVQESYNLMTLQAEQHLSTGEEDFIQVAMAQGSFPTISGPVRMTHDAERDTAVLAETLLCARTSLLFSNRIDPLFCMDHQVTIANPIYRAFRATVVAPFYSSVRLNLGRSLEQAMDEGRLSARGSESQIREIAQTGMVRAQGQTVVPSVRLLQLLGGLAAQSAPQTGKRAPDFGIISLIRPGQGPHGAAQAGGVQVGRAVDIGRYAGKIIDIAFPSDAAEGVAAVIRAMTPGCYVLGLPRPPRTDPDGGFEDAKKHQRFYAASVPQGQAPRLSPLGQAAVDNNPFLSAVNIGNCPTGTIDGDLKQLAPKGKAVLEPAVREAQARGVTIKCLFPDGPDHLHIQVEPCP